MGICFLTADVGNINILEQPVNWGDAHGITLLWRFEGISGDYLVLSSNRVS